MGVELTHNPSLRRFDFIVIHLDADVAEKNYSQANITNPTNNDLPCAKPCPPASGSVQALKRVISGWLDLTGQLPQPFVMCIPSMCTEAWIAVALYGEEDNDILSNIECKLDIENYLAQKPARERVIRNKNGKMKKITCRYSEKSEQITSQWDNITHHCDQASIFTEQIISGTISDT